jgi:predicted patatin/cPLA2 family phospholipase
MHEVQRILRERAATGSRPGHRTDGYRVALSIEGGGMRGTVSAGMALAVAELGLVNAFDAVYGSSAGAITGAWLLSSTPEGLRGWADPDYARTLIRWSSLLRGRPVVDVKTLVEVVYQSEFPMDFASVLASPVEYHPLGTDAETGESTDLRPLIGDPAELRLALRASASLPFLAGPPVELRGRRFFDAGVAESVPFRTPLAQGATHILVLRSRRPFASETAGHPGAAAADAAGAALDGPATGQAPLASAGNLNGEHRLAGRRIRRRRPTVDGAHGANGASAEGGASGGNGEEAATGRTPPRSSRILVRTALRHESPALRMALLTRPVRTAADVTHIALKEAEGKALTIYPPHSTPPVSRLTTDPQMLAEALEAGRQAARDLLRE